MMAQQDQDDEDAALWVARHMNHVVDATAFAQWLAGDAGRRAKFDALHAICMDEAVADGIRLYERNRATSRAASPPRPGRRAAIGIGAVAACAAIATLAWPALRPAAVPALLYATRPGEVRGVTLADGSKIMLNGASRITARIDKHRRDIALEAGEALFDVAHDADRPFSVAAGAGRVTVLGTRFDLALNGDRVDLAVERGLVRFATGTGDAAPVLVPATHRSALADGRIAPPVAFVAPSATDWREGWLQVEDLPLAQVLPQLQRWSDRTITVADRSLLASRITGRFRLSQPDVVLDNLAVLYGFRVQRTDTAYIMARSR